MNAAQEELSFTCFPENYRWSHRGLLSAPTWRRAAERRSGKSTGSGCGSRTASATTRPGSANGRARRAPWSSAGVSISTMAGPSAARNIFSAPAPITMWASASCSRKARRGFQTYMRGVACLRDAAQHIKRPRLEHVEIRHGDTSLPPCQPNLRAAIAAETKLPPSPRGPFR